MIHWLVLLLTIVLVIFHPKTSLVRKRTYTSALSIRRLLNPQDVTITALLRARATPNERLVHAFGLTSAFVSSDVKVHRDFTSRARQLIAGVGIKDRGWRVLLQSTDEAVHRFLPEQNLDFATFVQCVTFTVVLVGLFKVDPDTLHRQDVIYVTDIINKRWSDSKTKNANAMRQDDSLREITERINGWIADREQYPNPLNFILPAYETMWRLVAVTVAHVYRCRGNTLHDTVIAFGKNPTEEQFQSFAEDDQHPSMQAIILEALRLHPPTRHIGRASGASWWKKPFVPSIEIADIEAVHLSEEYGENTSEFNPMRFHPSHTQGRPDLFAFGHGKLSCIAAAWAPMAAAVMVANIIEQMEEESFTLTMGPHIGGRNGWEGWTVVKEREHACWQ
ncbi:hypothetical protein PAXRUDRAFT_833429 [Paxillus rubicundulus Ve08.2h10]|uniref:Cytochrome P450 n=1 Tax=Paxillus rubicundulus Ve08.2h10 TaxID=930991 RepID=A0A0D0CYB3_9AGAM|nr:hypothetical protein PAXRUDRAFT_833429 [Paxillus rubicundulus Ve08.2h10]